MINTRLFAFAALALSLAACTNDNENLNDGPVAAQFIADITPATRVNQDGTDWTDGDRIGITGAGFTNVPYKRENGKFVTDGTTIYFNDTETKTFNAYYPYQSDGGTVTVNTAADKQGPGIDFLFASGAKGSTRSPEVSFTDKTDKGGEDNSFHHCMSQITLTFKEGSGVDFSTIQPTGYTLSGLMLTGSFDTTTGTAETDDATAAQDLDMTLTNGALTSSVILFPQTKASIALSVYYNSQPYTATLTIPDGALKAGNNYTWTVTVRNKDLSISSATISDWNPVNGGNVNADL